ncbi:MAG TPA: hypothetical protein VGY58_03925 [Gemmataceae bacterium]|nr:hypothetical protein [Gemmataceae bacterium]
MRNMRKPWAAGLALLAAGGLAALGCYHTPVDNSEYAQGPAPLRMPSPEKNSCCYEDSLTGGQVFDMYCSYCHNAPALGERNFANFKNVATHMRIRANLTGKEYAKLMEFLQRWHDVPSPHPAIEPSPKRLIFAQPISELRPQTPARATPAAPQAQAPEESQRPAADAAQPNGQP